MKVKLIRYSCQSAYMAGEAGHPQEVMKEKGITYKHATPQSMGDQWWFWVPENIPGKLPKYLTVLEVDPYEKIGFGINKEIADMLIENI